MKKYVERISRLVTTYSHHCQRWRPNRISALTSFTIIGSTESISCFGTSARHRYPGHKPTPYDKMTTLENLNFDNLALRELPIDPKTDRSSRQVPGACFSRVDPLPVKNPVVVAHATDALELLDLPETESARPEFAEFFGGCAVLPGSQPAAHCYCGHQFGHFSGQLGDGAAM